jgi:hypothetical protein
MQLCHSPPPVELLRAAATVDVLRGKWDVGGGATLRRLVLCERALWAVLRMVHIGMLRAVWREQALGRGGTLQMHSRCWRLAL